MVLASTVPQPPSLETNLTKATPSPPPLLSSLVELSQLTVSGPLKVGQIIVGEVAGTKLGKQALLPGYYGAGSDQVNLCNPHLPPSEH